jgi:hypothetical protein
MAEERWAERSRQRPKDDPAEDEHLEQLAKQVTEVLFGSTSWSAHFDEDKKAVWCIETFHKPRVMGGAPLTEESLAKLLRLLARTKNSNGKTARDQLFYVSRFVQELADYLIKLGVSPRELVAQWGFSSSDALQLIIGVLVGLAKPLGLGLPDLVVFGFIIGAIGTLAGPITTGACALVLPFLIKVRGVSTGGTDALTPPQIQFPVEIRNAEDVIAELAHFFESPKRAFVNAFGIEKERAEFTGLRARA